MARADAQKSDRSRALRDLVVVTAVIAATFVLLLATGATIAIEASLKRVIGGGEDEALLGFGLMSLGLGLLAVLRWRDAARHLAARRAAEERFRAVVEKIPAVTYTWDPNPAPGSPRVLFVSPQVEPILGFTVQQWTQDQELWLRQVHPDDRERVLAASEHSDRTGEPFVAEYRHRRSDGRYVWIHEEALAVARGPRGPTLVQGVMFDVTERRHAEERLREAEERYRAIVEHVPGAIYVDVPDGSMRTVYVSPQIRTILGVSTEDWIADPELWLSIMHPEDREAMRSSYARAVASHAAWSGEYRVMHPAGRWVWVHDETTFVDDEDGRPLFLQGVLFDITDRKRAEEALQSSERRERQAAERLRALDEMKNAFLAAVSHELRSPLTSILGLSLTLQQQDMPAADRRDLLDRLATNARKLDRLLGDLLDIDRLKRGIVAPKHRRIDLADVVRRTIETLDGAGDRSIVLDLASVTIQADPAKVERIVENLVVNGLRHTAAHVTLWVRVQPVANGALIAVEDDGAGVASELRHDIFAPFRQGPSASPHSPGTGIGLALVSMFAELHGGRAWVEERTGGGASFRVFLPASPQQGAASDRDRAGEGVPVATGEPG